MSARALFLAAVLGVLTMSSRARAVDPFEIQVYQAEINRPGQFGLEVHLNHVVKGRRDPAYDGEIAPHHLTHLTLEPALGVLPWLELGAYLQSMVDAEGTTHFGGVKLRAKIIPKKFGPGWYYGLNVEFGRVPQSVDPNGWANEFRPIVGWNDGHVLIGLNPIFGYDMSGPQAFRPHFEPALKIAVNTQRGFSVGTEYYAGFGLVTRGFDPWRSQEHLLFFAFDLAERSGSSEGGDDEEEEDWELNVAIGRGLTQATDQTWVAKMIVGKPF